MLRINALLLTVGASVALAACAGESGGAAVQGELAPATHESTPAFEGGLETPGGFGTGAGAGVDGAAASEGAPVTRPQGSQAGAPVAVGPGTAPAAGGGSPMPAGAAQGGAAAPVAQVETAPDAEAILGRAETAYDAIRTLEASFVQDLSVPLLNSTQRSRGQLFVRKPDRFLMRFSDPAGDVVVADGTHLWMYYPSTDARQVVRTSASQGGQGLDLQREFLSNPTARYRAVLNGTESVGGRPAHVLTLTPRAASPYQRVRIWVDTQDHLVRRFEIVETNESVRRLELSGLRPNATVPDQLFRFTPPAGAQVFDQ